jgi:lipopolysaccharide export system permease protein
MRRLRQYLWRAVVLPSLGVIGVLVSLDCLFSFIRELEFLRGNYQALEALQFVATTSPRRFYEFLPMGILLGTLLGLGLLANSGELTVIRAAGVSTGRISWMVLRPALLLLVLGMLTGEYLAPYTEQVAQSNRSIAEGGGEALRSKYGYWHREGNEFIHINAVQPNGVLYGVTRYQFDDAHRLRESQYIERALYQDEAGYWFLENVKGSRLGDERVDTYRKANDIWRTRLTPALLSIVILEPKYLAPSKLLEYARYRERQGLKASEYMLSFWQKVLRPVATIGMVLIAISFIFGPLREVSMGLRMTAGIVAGLVFHYGQQFFGHLSLVFDTWPLIAASVPPLICMLLGVVLLSRVR